MFYLTTHSTHFILRLYGVGHMVKDHSDSEKGNPLPTHGVLFPINSKGYFICTIPHRIAHTTAFVTPVVEHWLEQEIAQLVCLTKDRSDDPSHHERTLLPWSYVSLPYASSDVMVNCEPIICYWHDCCRLQKSWRYSGHHIYSVIVIKSLQRKSLIYLSIQYNDLPVY